jgi:hypothetical protein
MLLQLLRRNSFPRKRGAAVGGRRPERGALALERLEERDLPAPLTFAAGVGLPSARGGVVAVLQGGEILVLGGPTTDTSSLTVTDPTWKATLGSAAPQDMVRSAPGVGITPDGGVLLFGGKGQGGGALSATTRYDYTGNNTDSVSELNTPRALLGSATDQNHLVYAIGGINDSGTPLGSVEAYQQSTDTWSLRASLPQTLYSESAVGDGNGHLFTFGGVGANGQITANVYEYTVATNTWSTAAAMPVAVRDSAAVLGPNGKIYVLGGTTASGATAGVESYNPSTNTWTTEAPLPAPVRSEAAIVDYLGRIETLGGYDAKGNPVSSVWISQELNQPDAAPAIYTYPYTVAYTGKPYSYQVLSTANPQATYSLTQAPVGMSINSATGLISWAPTPSQVGSSAVTVQASNYAGQQSQSFTINVLPSPPTTPTNLTVTGTTISSISLSWSASTDPVGVAGYTVYHYYVTGHSGRGGGITYHHDPVLTVTGTSGTVTGLGSGVSYTYEVAAFDKGGRYSAYSNPVTDTTWTLPTFTGAPSGTTYNLKAKHAFTTTLTATGDPTDFKFSILNPPTGMTVNATTGRVGWTPPDNYVGTTKVTFQVSSSAGKGNTVTYDFAVAPNLPVPQYTSANRVNGTLYATPSGQLNMQLSDSFSHSTVTWLLVSGPVGMKVNASTGAVTWTPPANTPLGTIDVTFKATNYAGSADLTVPIDVVFASAPTNVKDSNVTVGSGGASATISWGPPATNANNVAQYEILVTQPGGTTGTFTTTYTVSGSTRQLNLTGLDVSSLITIEVVAVDSKGHLGMPTFITFVTPF